MQSSSRIASQGEEVDRQPCSSLVRGRVPGRESRGSVASASALAPSRGFGSLLWSTIVIGNPLLDWWSRAVSVCSKSSWRSRVQISTDQSARGAPVTPGASSSCDGGRVPAVQCLRAPATRDQAVRDVVVAELLPPACRHSRRTPRSVAGPRRRRSSGPWDGGSTSRRALPRKSSLNRPRSRISADSVSSGVAT